MSESLGQFLWFLDEAILCAHRHRVSLSRLLACDVIGLLCFVVVKMTYGKPLLWMWRSQPWTKPRSANREWSSMSNSFTPLAGRIYCWLISGFQRKEFFSESAFFKLDIINLCSSCTVTFLLNGKFWQQLLNFGVYTVPSWILRRNKCLHTEELCFGRKYCLLVRSTYSKVLLDLIINSNLSVMAAIFNCLAVNLGSNQSISY